LWWYWLNLLKNIHTNLVLVWWKGGGDETLDKWNNVINSQKLNMTKFWVVECDVKWKLNFLHGICVHGFCFLLVMRKVGFTLDDVYWIVGWFLWVHLLWFGYSFTKALMVVCWVMEFMLNIKGHHYLRTWES